MEMQNNIEQIMIDRKAIAERYKAMIDATKKEKELVKKLIADPHNAELIKQARIAYLEKYFQILEGNLTDYILYHKRYTEHSEK